MHRSWFAGFRDGALAAFSVSALLVAARFAFGFPTPFDLLENELTRAIPPKVFAFLLDRLLFSAKPLLLVGVFLGQVGLGGIAGILFHRRFNRLRPTAASPSRRRLLAGLAVGTSSLAVLSVADRLWLAPPATRPESDNVALGPTRVSVPLRVPTDPTWTIPGLGPEITPSDKFYAVTKNLFEDPQLDPRDWSLSIRGLVERPLHLRYADLLRLPAVEFYQTLECISNPVGGDLMSTAWWRGVRVADLLSMAGADPQAGKVVFRAADGYADSLPLARAVLPTTTLVYQMNGRPLPRPHGFPIRLLTPGVYGLKNVKWIAGLEVIRGDFAGYWQERGWSDTARVQTTSRVDVPAANATLRGGQILIAGVAFAGDRGISRVQVKIDAEKAWQDALLKPALGPLTWRLWRYEATLPPGSHSVVVQAVDGTGEVQWALPQDTIPDGATGNDLEVFTTR